MILKKSLDKIHLVNSMAIKALSYLGVNSQKIQDWSSYATKKLGMQEIDKTKNSLMLRMDDQKQRFSISNDGGEGLAFMGWEVENESDLESFSSKLEKNQYRVFRGEKSLCDKRFVEELIYFYDPAGNKIELIFNPFKTDEEFKPGRAISGFETGICGLGHAVLHTDNIEPLVRFYKNILDFKVSDYSLKPIKLHFFHVNERHHSFALVETGKVGFHHFMVEYKNLDDVGQGYDLFQFEDNQIAYTMGRHTNDYMTSFYSYSPSGFFVENGWGGRIIDPRTWEPELTDIGPSFWGHERLHLPEDQRRIFRNKRMEIASNGIQAPLVVNCPWLYQNNLKK